MKLTFIILLMLYSLVCNGQSNYPGGLVELRIVKQSQELPEIKYGLLEPVLIDRGSFWRVLIGISLQTLPGEYLVYLKHAVKGTSGEHLKILIQQKDYPFHEEAGIAINRQRPSMSEIDFNNTQQPELPLALPMQGDWSDDFGHQFFNLDDNKVVTQNAISLTTTEVANVVSPQHAIVSKIDVDDADIATIYLDHGRGLYSIIEGLTDLTINIGNGVVAGAVLGKLPGVDNTGSPHRLVWQVQLNGVFVDPVLLTKISP